MINLILFLLALPNVIIVSALALTNNPSLVLAGSVITNVTSVNYFHECNGRRYSTNLNRASCMDALSQIDGSSTTEQTYGPRFQGPFDVKLPKRYASCSSPSLRWL